MSVFKVLMERRITFELEVEAKDEWEAEELVEKDPNQYSDGSYLSDEVSILEVSGNE